MARTKTSPGAIPQSKPSRSTPRASSPATKPDAPSSDATSRAVSPESTRHAKSKTTSARGSSSGGQERHGIHHLSAAAPLAPGHLPADAQQRGAGSNPLTPGHPTLDAHSRSAGAFSLRAHAREFVADRTGDLRTLADEFSRSVPEDALRDVLAECAPDVLRRAMREIRGRTTKPQGTPWFAREDKKAKRVPLSHKLAAFIYPDPFNAGQTKFLRDFTADDCAERASHLERHADDTMAEAEKFRRLASEVKTRGRTTVNGLREELVLSILEGDEA